MRAVWGAAAGVVVSTACSFDWQQYDPRDSGSGATGAANSGAGATGGATGSTASGGAAGSTSVGAMGGAGGDGGNGGAIVASGGNGGAGGVVAPCNTIEDPITGHCYQHLSGMSMSWDAARTACQALGATWDLAAISSQNERDFLDPQLTGNATWLGGRDVLLDDTFQWVNGEAWNYAPWEAGDPNGGNEDCIQFMHITGAANNEFRDNPCATTMSFPLCERPP